MIERLPHRDVIPVKENKVPIESEIKARDGKAGGVSRPDDGGVGVVEYEVTIGGEVKRGFLSNRTGAVGRPENLGRGLHGLGDIRATVGVDEAEAEDEGGAGGGGAVEAEGKGLTEAAAEEQCADG